MINLTSINPVTREVTATITCKNLEQFNKVAEFMLVSTPKVKKPPLEFKHAPDPIILSEDSKEFFKRITLRSRGPSRLTVARLVSEGKSNVDIVRITGISGGAVAAHLTNLYALCNVQTRPALVGILLHHFKEEDNA